MLSSAITSRNDDIPVTDPTSFNLDDGISGYNMGCKSLPNRVEHYHLPRMLMSGIALCDRAIANLGMGAA